MRVVGRVLAGLITVYAVLMPSSTAHASFAGSADLEAKTVGGHASLGKIAGVVIGIVNHGPGDPEGGTVTLDVTAPAGTVFDAATEASFAECQMPTPHRRVLCNPGSKIDFTGGSVSFQLGLKVTSRCVTPGRFSVKYSQDPKTSNNAVPLTVKVDGVDAKACTTPKPSPSVRATPRTSPVAASPSAAVIPTLAASPSAAAIPTSSPSAAETPSSVAALQPTSGDSGPGTAGLALAGAAILAVLAMLAVLLRRFRSRKPAGAVQEETS